MSEKKEKKETKPPQSGAPQEWGFQEQFFKNWQDAFKQGAEQWQKNFGQANFAFPGTEFWKNWNDMFFKQFAQFSGQNQEGLGPVVFAKVMNAGAIYSKVMEFWQSAWNTMNAISIPTLGVRLRLRQGKTASTV